MLRDDKRNKTWRSQAATLGWNLNGDEPKLVEDGLAEKWQHRLVATSARSRCEPFSTCSLQGDPRYASSRGDLFFVSRV